MNDIRIETEAVVEFPADAAPSIAPEVEAQDTAEPTVFVQDEAFSEDEVAG